MRGKISLKLYISMIFLVLTGALIIGYSLLSARYYLLGMDSITATSMIKAATEYLDSAGRQQGAGVSSFQGFLLAEQWGNMPGEVRSLLPEGPAVQGKLMIVDNAGFLKPPDKITFAMVYRRDNRTLYIAKHEFHSPDSSSEKRSDTGTIIRKNAKRNLHTLFLITVSSALIIGLITWLLLRQVSRPVSALGEWARALDEKQLQLPPPDFHYPELNELAELIRTSLRSVEEGLDREHRFLRHASHELRTPIGVIRNNVELIQKLQEHPSQDSVQKQQQVLDRIDRASLNMKHMTETLLWLSREEDHELPVHPVRLDNLVNEHAENLLYLAAGKKMEIAINTSPCMVEIPETVASIVLGNLIRNAFQHTHSGSVRIDQQENKVTIVNTLCQPAQKGDDLGFGLGLQLIGQLTEKTGWPYENIQGPFGNTVSITIMGKQRPLDRDRQEVG